MPQCKMYIPMRKGDWTTDMPGPKKKYYAETPVNQTVCRNIKLMIHYSENGPSRTMRNFLFLKRPNL